MGGNSGGGGSSGKVEYPTYMQTVHNDWLDNTGVDTMTNSINDLMEASIGSSPWSGATPYDPATPLSDAWTAVCAFNTLADALDNETDWSSAISAALADYDGTIDADTELADGWNAIGAFNTLIDALDHEADWASALAVALTGFGTIEDDDSDDFDDVQAFSQVMFDDLKYVKIPEFEAGYRDANAVNSSAFGIGKSVIFGMHQRDVAKYATGIREEKNKDKNQWLLEAVKDMLNNQMKRVEFEQAVAKLSDDHKMKAHVVRVEAITKSTEVMLSNLMQRVQFEQAVAQLSVEAKRIHIVASKEEVDQGYAFDEADGRWDLETYQYGCNVLAAIAGAAASVGKQRPSSFQSALGGALSGAAMGSAVAPGVGTVVGGILGAGAALLGG